MNGTQHPADAAERAGDTASGISGAQGSAPAIDVSLNAVTLVAGERTLLKDSQAHFSAGRITLVVGPSGVGKSLLLKAMAGLLRHGDRAVRVTGEMRIGGRPPGRQPVGVVFQSFALFDELSPRGNLQLAKDHGGRRAQAIDVDGLIDELQVPAGVPTSRLSGGQRQRLALARTLALNPPLILYDEPTSGLDPENAARVAQLIRATHQRHQATSIVVTHDYPALLPIADQVYLLDPTQRQLVPVPRERWSELKRLLEPAAVQTALISDQVPAARGGWQAVGRAVVRHLEGMTGVAQAAAVSLSALVPLWRSPAWGMRFLCHYMRLVAGPTAWVYLILAGMIIGFVTTYFIFRFLPFAGYTEPLLIDDLLSAIGFALYRILTPILATVLIAARCGAAVTADIASKQYGHQVDALRTLGASPRSYLLSPTMVSFVIGTPLLTLVAFAAARYASLAAFVATHTQYGPDFWYFHFHRNLHQLNVLWYGGTHWLVAKLVCCGLGIGAIAYHQGVREKFSSNDVSRAVNSAILWATLYVLVVHFVFAFLEF